MKQSLHDWCECRFENYDHQRFVASVRRLATDSGEGAVNDFIADLVPLINTVLSKRSDELSDFDFDDLCSHVVEVVVRKVRENIDWLAVQVNGVLYSWIRTILWRGLMDYYRCCKIQPLLDPSKVYVPRQLSVPILAELELMSEELPERLVEYILTKDRFKYGRQVILLVVRCLLSGNKVYESMLKNWFDVARPSRCISFVILMSRRYLYKRKVEYGGLLDCRLEEMMDKYGARVISYDYSTS